MNLEKALRIGIISVLAAILLVGIFGLSISSNDGSVCNAKVSPLRIYPDDTTGVAAQMVGLHATLQSFPSPLQISADV